MKTFLFDNPEDKEKVGFLLKENREEKTVFSPKGKKPFIAWIKGVKRTLTQTSDNDTIVCWYDFQAILLFWLCSLTFKRRKIVCINLLLKDKESLKNKVVSWLYRRALNSKHVVTSVTSLEYGEHLKKRLNVKKNFFLVHDVFHDSYKYDKQVSIKQDTVFCGGRNGRDWRFMVEVAKAMPHVEFHLVMPKDTYCEFKQDLPSNVVAKYNLPMDDFMEEMCSCEIVALPLDTEAPAGLIVLFQAAANMKYIITTDTMTMREYLSNGKGCLIENNVETWVNAINRTLGKDNVEASNELLNFLKTECSERKFVEGIELMIKEVQ